MAEIGHITSLQYFTVHNGNLRHNGKVCRPKICNLEYHNKDSKSKNVKCMNGYYMVTLHLLIQVLHCKRSCLLVHFKNTKSQPSDLSCTVIRNWIP